MSTLTEKQALYKVLALGKRNAPTIQELSPYLLLACLCQIKVEYFSKHR